MESNPRPMEMCRREEVRYWEVDFNPRIGYLGRDGLHLNARAADVVARQVLVMMETSNPDGRLLAQ